MSPDQPTNSTRRSGDAMRTRVSLLQRASDGSDQLAWEELLKFYEPFISKVLQSMGFRGPDLDDARQQVALVLWKGLQSYDRDPDRAKFRTWFARLIRNTAINIIRSNKRKPTGPSLNDDSEGNQLVIADDPELDARVELEWQEYVVGLAMERASKVFSGNAVEVFQMSLDGQSAENIAGQLSIKVNTVYILKHRVKAVLLKEIQQLKHDLESFGEVAAG